MLLLKVTKVTTGHQKLPKMGQNSIISSFFARRAKNASAEGRSPPQELEVSPRSGLYLLVVVKLNVSCLKGIHKSIKVSKVITGDQKIPKMSQNSIISSFFARKAKKALAEGRSPPQELEVSPLSGLYLLVIVNPLMLKNTF